METKTISLQALLGIPEISNEWLRNTLKLSPTTLQYTEWPAQENELEVVRHERMLLVRSAQVSSPARAAAWDTCWMHCYDQYVQTGDAASLLPDFLAKPQQPLRYLGRYIQAHPGALRTVQKAILATLLLQWFRGTALVEFGCGSGYNLALAHTLLPGGELLYGLDRSPQAIRCIRRLGFSGGVFDMLRPSHTLDNQSNKMTALTAGAMEQLGDRFMPFLEFLLSSRFKMCIHIEPVVELYGTSPLDVEAAQYHKARGYLSGFLPALQNLERAGTVRIHSVHRTHFGGRFNDGFSWIVWSPV